MSDKQRTNDFMEKAVDESSSAEQVLDPETSLYNTTRKGIVTAKSPGQALSKVENTLKQAEQMLGYNADYEISSPTVKNTEAWGDWYKNNSLRGDVKVEEKSRSEREIVYQAEIRLTSSNSTRRKILDKAVSILEWGRNCK